MSQPYTVYKSPNPLLFIAEGNEKNLPKQFEFSPFVATGFETTNAKRNYKMPSFEDIDWGFIIGLFVSFMAIVLTYDAISGECESGTLRLIMANSVSRFEVIFGKYLGAMLTILIPLCAGILLNLLIISTSDLINFNTMEWGKIAFVMLISLLFVSTFVFIGLLVSSSVKNSSTSLLLLLLIWSFFVVIMPGISGVIASEVIKVDTMKAFTDKLEYTDQQARDKFPPIGHGTIEPFFRFDQPLPVKMDRRAWREIEYFRESEKAKDNLYDEYRKSMFRQAKLEQNLARISPISVFRFACQKMIGSGIERTEDFASQTLKYRDELIEFIKSEDAKDEKSTHIFAPRISWTKLYSQKKPDFDSMPRFSEKPVELSKALSRAISDITILLLLNLVFFFVAYILFLIYEV
jgi:ABC-type transport system involved in multi-copper enzyme maturation permease subunit